MNQSIMVIFLHRQKQLTLGVEQGEEADRITFKYTDGAFLKERIQGVLDLVKWVQVTASDVGKNGNRDALNAILICSLERCYDMKKLKFAMIYIILLFV